MVKREPSIPRRDFANRQIPSPRCTLNIADLRLHPLDVVLQAVRSVDLLRSASFSGRLGGVDATVNDKSEL